MHILIAEDDIPVAKFLSGGLSNEHYDVRIAAAGGQIMPMIESNCALACAFALSNSFSILQFLLTLYQGILF